MRFINLWKYWRKKYGCRDFTLISIDINDSVISGGRIVIFNIGIMWNN